MHDEDQSVDTYKRRRVLSGLGALPSMWFLERWTGIQNHRKGSDQDSRLQSAQPLDSPPPTAWANVYGGEDSDDLVSAIEVSEGGYLAAGYTKTGLNGWLLKVGANGGEEWSQTYEGGAEDTLSDERFYSVIEISDGGYLAVGRTGGAGDFNGWLVKIGPDGSKQSTQTFGDWLWSIIEAKNDGYLAAGWQSSSEDEIKEGLVVKVGADGSEKWTETYNVSEGAQLYSIEAVGEGYIASGRATPASGESDGLLLKLSADGGEEWTQTYHANDHETLYSVTDTSDGGYIASGRTWLSDQEYKAWIVKAGSDGAKKWTETYGVGTGSQLTSITEIDEDGYLACGRTASFETESSTGWLVKFGSEGNKQWAQNYDGDEFDNLFSILETSDDGYLTTGNTESMGPGERAGWLRKLDPALGRLDTDNNGTIGFGEVLGTISAFNTGGEIGGESVGFTDVLDAIRSFNSS